MTDYNQETIEDRIARTRVTFRPNSGISETAQLYNRCYQICRILNDETAISSWVEGLDRSIDIDVAYSAVRSWKNRSAQDVTMTKAYSNLASSDRDKMFSQERYWNDQANLRNYLYN